MDRATLSAPTRAWLERGRHLSVQGHQVYIQERGEGPVLVMLHGFPTSSFDWKRVIDELESDFRCIALDFPGFGLSDKPIAYSYSLFQQADIVEGVLAALHIDEAHILSHDMGTSVHTELLARTIEGRLPFTITTSSFLNGSMIKDMATLTSFQKLLEAPANLPEAMEVCENLLPVYVPTLKGLMERPEMVDDEEAATMTELLQYQEGNRRIPAVYSYVRERYLHMDRWLGALAQMPAPTQFVWAAGDPVANIAMGEELARRVPDARFVPVPDVGHFIPLEAPDVVADEVRSFAVAHPG